MGPSHHVCVCLGVHDSEGREVPATERGKKASVTAVRQAEQMTGGRTDRQPRTHADQPINERTGTQTDPHTCAEA